MIEVTKHGIILEKTEHDFENQAVLNPATIRVGDDVHVFYRAVQEGNRSSIGYARLSGPLEVAERYERPIIFPEKSYEKQGIEDPRIVWFEEEGLYYLFYTAYDGQNALGAYAVSEDLKKWEKMGVITPTMSYSQAEKFFGHGVLDPKYYYFEEYYNQRKGKGTILWEKDIFLLPRKINGKYALIHRILPDAQVMYFDNFEQLKDYHFWEEYLGHLSDHTVITGESWFEDRNVGGGAPFINLSEGWLSIYHGVQNTENGKVYHAGATLLHSDDPTKVIGKLDYPLISPTEEWEKQGDVSNVIFPTGTSIFDGELYIYYGAADSRIAVGSLIYHDLLEELI